ncbi:DinB family protein [Actinospica sp. MGRD01-02]|uniref:DinB family protein n=1 Tax=Actinospica acidithermotolerans TaxID=2828514 RepID=A0A941IL89_9ACTN|nr:DinB family protein [Actinospica acidithermotolerans]MBR7827396.1 DinB family protein [Actinospica acidithermotolerans]
MEETRTRTEVPLDTVDERTLFDGFLDFHRDTLDWKASRLADDQLRAHAVPASNLTLLGMLRHMAEVERFWFREVWAGEKFERGMYDRTDDRDEEWNDLDSDTGPAAYARWRAEVERARAVVAGTPDLDAVFTRGDTGERVSARWILIHMVEEYARHNGHADLLRESLDGEVGE